MDAPGNLDVQNGLFGHLPGALGIGSSGLGTGGATISNSDGDYEFADLAAGTYTITELSTTQETGKSTSPLLPVSGGLLLAAGGITPFRRKRHG